jgi:GT2 family glycosyltransferase
VIVVNWNAREYLRRCLTSILEETRARVSIIVVDNASSDGSAEMVRAAFPSVQLIANSENRGFAAANNQGLRLVKGDWALLLNPDTVILDSAIDRIVALAATRPDAGILGCRVLEAEGVVQRTCFGYPGPWNLFLVEFGLCRLCPRSRLLSRPVIGWWDRDTERDVDVVSGMFMLVRKTAMDQVGLMDEDYFIYAEEADWCFRFRKRGWRCLFWPGAAILHCEGGGKSTAQVRARMHVQLQKSLLLFNRKNLGRWAWAMAKLVFVCSSLGRLLVWATVGAGLKPARARERRRLAIAGVRYQLAGAEPGP